MAAIPRTYGYDANNHLNQAGEWQTLSHDVSGRLVQAGLSATEGVPVWSNDGPLVYGYDGYGNNTAASGARGDALNNFSLAVPVATNQVPGLATNGALTGWAYNANGEAQTLGKATGSATPQLAIAWDGLGRVSGVGYENFAYLPSGLRANRTDSQDWAQNRIYAYSTAGQLLTEFRQSGASPQSLTARDVVYLGGEAIAELEAGGIHELHCDHLGSPIMITSRSTGRAEGWQFFGPYGEALSRNGYLPATGYTGHAQTDFTGLIYMRGRFYSPAWHRFLNSDQGADPGQLNQFAYCGGSPMMGTDPTGMAAGLQYRELPPERIFNGRDWIVMPWSEGGSSFFSTATRLSLFANWGGGLPARRTGSQTSQGSGGNFLGDLFGSIGRFFGFGEADGYLDVGGITGERDGHSVDLVYENQLTVPQTIIFNEPVRSPDYVSVTGAIYAGVGGGVTLTVDKWGRRYWNSTKGFGVGKGASIVFGTIFDGPHDKDSVAKFLNATSFTFQADFGAAGGFTSSVDGISAYEIGAGGPGFSFTWNSDLLKGW